MNIAPFNIMPEGDGAVGALTGMSVMMSRMTATSNLTATSPVRKYQTAIGDGVTTVFAIAQTTHGLPSDGSIIAQVRGAAAPYFVSYPDVGIDPTNGTVTVVFAVAPTNAQYRLILIG